MLNEILCGNFSRFDPESGKYLECGEKIIVSADDIGKFVTCSKCQQQVEVPFGFDTAPVRTKDPQPRPATKKQKVAGQEIPSAKKKRRRKPAGEPTPTTATRKKKRRPKAAAKQPDGEDMKLAAVEPRMRATDIMSMNFDNTNVESTLVEDEHERCTKCGNVSKSGRCTVCRHVEQSFEKLHQNLDEIKIERVGFQRWFCRTMNDDSTLAILEYGAHLGLGVISAMLLVLGGMSVGGFGFGRVQGILMCLFVVTAIIFYIGLVYKGKQFRRDPRAKLAWFQKPIWNGILGVARMMKWQNYDSSLKGRTIIKVRETTFGDHEISELENLNRCQVLDLQGTKVTDRGLLELYSLKHLQCLVLRNTNVSDEGIFRLQQSFPRLWIWY